MISIPERPSMIKAKAQEYTMKKITTISLLILSAATLASCSSSYPTTNVSTTNY